MDKIDQLIESAFAKDKAQLPQQPALPAASLLEKVRATKPAATAASSGSGFFASMSMKVVGTMTLMAVIATVVFLMWGPKTVTEMPGDQTTFPPQADTIRQTTVTEQPAQLSLKDSVKLKSKPTKNDSIASSTSRINSESDLIMPTTPPAIYTKDSATVNLKKR